MLAELSTSQWTFLTGMVAYPLTFYLATPKNAPPARFAQSREAISIFHCSLMIFLSLDCLRRSSILTLLATPSQEHKSYETYRYAAVNDRDLPIITTRSKYANSITALETAYLLQDSIILFFASRLHQRTSATSTKPVKGLNITHLAWHHAGLSASLGFLQYYIAQGREKGILLIIMMMLMNASSPFGTVRWFLVNFKPQWKRAITAFTVAYLSMYAVCRIYLVYYILKVFGAQKGLSPLETFLDLRWQCQLGTGAMGMVNSAWLAMSVSNFVRRSLKASSLHRK